METLKELLNEEGCLGVVCSQGGDIRQFRRRGVIDLFTLLTNEPAFLHGATIADKVIGRGAALLLVKGGIGEVFARLISTSALEVLRARGISVSFDQEVPNIINRDGTDICPVEKLTANITDPDEAYCRIEQFLKARR